MVKSTVMPCLLRLIAEWAELDFFAKFVKKIHLSSCFSANLYYFSEINDNT